MTTYNDPPNSTSSNRPSSGDIQLVQEKSHNGEQNESMTIRCDDDGIRLASSEGKLIPKDRTHGTSRTEDQESDSMKGGDANCSSVEKNLDFKAHTADSMLSSHNISPLTIHTTPKKGLKPKVVRNLFGVNRKVHQTPSKDHSTLLARDDNIILGTSSENVTNLSNLKNTTTPKKSHKGFPTPTKVRESFSKCVSFFSALSPTKKSPRTPGKSVAMAQSPLKDTKLFDRHIDTPENLSGVEEVAKPSTPAKQTLIPSTVTALTDGSELADSPRKVENSHAEMLENVESNASPSKTVVSQVRSHVPKTTPQKLELSPVGSDIVLKPIFASVKTSSKDTSSTSQSSSKQTAAKKTFLLDIKESSSSNFFVTPINAPSPPALKLAPEIFDVANMTGIRASVQNGTYFFTFDFDNNNVPFSVSSKNKKKSKNLISVLKNFLFGKHSEKNEKSTKTETVDKAPNTSQVVVDDHKAKLNSEDNDHVDSVTKTTEKQASKEQTSSPPTYASLAGKVHPSLARVYFATPKGLRTPRIQRNLMMRSFGRLGKKTRPILADVNIEKKEESNPLLAFLNKHQKAMAMKSRIEQDDASAKQVLARMQLLSRGGRVSLSPMVMCKRPLFSDPKGKRV